MALLQAVLQAGRLNGTGTIAISAWAVQAHRPTQHKSEMLCSCCKAAHAANSNSAESAQWCTPVQPLTCSTLSKCGFRGASS